MNNILRELVEIISQSKIGIDKVMRYLLGEVVEKQNLDSRTYYQYFNEQINVKRDIRINIGQSKDWSCGRFKKIVEGETRHKAINIEELLKKARVEIEKLYNDNIISFRGDVSWEMMIQKLVYKHFFGTYNVANLFVEKDITRNKKNVIWASKRKDMEQAMAESSLVFITGNPGCGKTRLAKNYLLDKKATETKFLNYVCIDCSQENKKLSEYSINVVCIGGRVLNTWRDFLEAVDKIDKETYVIVDRPILSEDDLNFIENNFVKQNVKFVITTRRQIPEEKYRVVCMNRWQFEQLKEIADMYISENKRKFINNEQYEQFFEATGHNPYLVELISKSVCDTYWDENGEIKLLEIFSRKGTDKLKPVHSDYQKGDSDPASTITNLLDKILMPYYDIEKDMVKLSLWAYATVSKQILIEIAGISEETIDVALQKSFLIRVPTEQDLFKMPEIVAEAVWRRRPIEYQEYREIVVNSFQVLQKESMDSLFSYKSMYETWWYMVERIHKQISTVLSQNKKKQKEEFKKWALVLEELKAIADSMGNTVLTKRINELLYLRYEKGKKLDEATEVQRFKKIQTDIKGAYVTDCDSEKRIKAVLNSFSSIFNCQNVQDQKEMVKELSSRIFEVYDDKIQRYNVDLLRTFPGGDIFEYKSVCLESIGELIQLLESNLELQGGEIIEHKGTKYISQRGYKLPYYRMIFHYIDSIPANNVALKFARRCFEECYFCSDDEWKVRSLLAAYTYECAYKAYVLDKGIVFTDDFMPDFEEIQTEVLKKIRAKEILELFYLAGFWKYLILNKKEESQTGKSFILFWEQVIKTHMEQFTLNEREKNTLLKIDEEMRSYFKKII